MRAQSFCPNSQETPKLSPLWVLIPFLFLWRQETQAVFPLYADVGGGRPSVAGPYQMAVIQFGPNNMTLLCPWGWLQGSSPQPPATCHGSWQVCTMRCLCPPQRHHLQKQCQDPAPTRGLEIGFETLELKENLKNQIPFVSCQSPVSLAVRPQDAWLGTKGLFIYHGDV